MKKLKAALLVDNISLAKWQFDALKNADHKLDVTYILNCTKLTIDYYENKFSLLAGIRRLLAKLVEN